jgi:hypothetical protein
MRPHLEGCRSVNDRRTQKVRKRIKRVRQRIGERKMKHWVQRRQTAYDMDSVGVASGPSVNDDSAVTASRAGAARPPRGPSAEGLADAPHGAEPARSPPQFHRWSIEELRALARQLQIPEAHWKSRQELLEIFEAAD